MNSISVDFEKGLLIIDGKQIDFPVIVEIPYEEGFPKRKLFNHEKRNVCERSELDKISIVYGKQRNTKQKQESKSNNTAIDVEVNVDVSKVNAVIDKLKEANSLADELDSKIGKPNFDRLEELLLKHIENETNKFQETNNVTQTAMELIELWKIKCGI